MSRRRLRRGLAGLVGGLAILLLAGAAAAERELRVCADPNNLPFSNQQGEGFENRLAEMIADDLQAELQYAWWPQRRGFIRNTLNAGRCDLVLGVPAGYDLVATTAPYYRSTYVFVYRQDRSLDLTSLGDPRLRTLRIGVHLIGDDGINTPPAHALGRQGIVDNVVGYMIYGNYAEPSPPARLVEAVAKGAVDVAALWGPVAGYFAARSAVPLQVVPIADAAAFAPQRFAFAMAAGVRKDDTQRLKQIEAVLARQRAAIRALLQDFDVPLLETEADGRRH